MKLLSPIKLGAHEVRNRIVSTAHAAYTDFWKPGSDGERYIAYQERRAEGGAGLLINTAMSVHRSSQFMNHFVYDAADIAPKYQRMSQRVHRHGAKLIQQILHWGANEKSDSRDDWHPVWGWSEMTTNHGEPVHEMNEDEIEEVIQAFVNTAVVCVENGLDGVELHGTHGYLIQQSWSPYANRRTDRWGAPLLFITTLAERVRAAIGPDKMLGFRISGDDWLTQEQGGVGAEGARNISAAVIGTGLFDYLNHSMGTGGASYAHAIGSYRYKFGEFLPLTRGLAEAIGRKVPTIGVGKIPTPDLAERALQNGDCDLVGMTRAQIADPDLAKKLMAGQASRIRTCTGSNQGCYDRARFGISCFHNPEVGEENRFRKLAAEPVVKKKVLVVGGGPAGMKAAEIAAKRGHDVVLAEASHRLGGRLNMVESLDAASNLLTATSWIEQELAHHGVEVRLQTSVDEAFARALGPDAIVMATGAIPTARIDGENDESIPVISSDDAVRGEIDGEKFDLAGTRALVIDTRANYEIALMIESLARRGSAVTVVTPHIHWGVNIGASHRTDYFQSLPAQGVALLPLTKLEKVAQGKAHLRDLSTQRETIAPFDFIVAGSTPRAQDQLFEVLSRIAPTKNVGDSIAARSAMEAIREGDRAGRTL